MTERYEQPDLPYFEEQDKHEAFIRHKQAMAMRWFGYYRKCKDQKKRLKLIDQYNFLAQSKRSR